MATLTIRNVPQRVVRRLKSLARQQDSSMEQLVRDLLEQHAGDRASVLRQIEASYERQARRPTAEEIDDWISNGRDS
jgi:plasmid stability protein